MAVERLSMDWKSSIEDEPLTLGIYQLRFAMEAALYVIHTMSMEDALRIFTEGLEPMVCHRDVNLIYSEEEEGRKEFPGRRDIVSVPFLLYDRPVPKGSFRLVNGFPTINQQRQ